VRGVMGVAGGMLGFGICVAVDGRTGTGGPWGWEATAARRAAGGLMPEKICTWKRRGRVIVCGYNRVSFSLRKDVTEG
jgi:hypothetical protein